MKVPYREDGYWTTFGKRDAARTKKFETLLLSKVSAKSLPRISDLASAQMLAVEDENMRRCAAYAKNTLGL